MVLNFGNWFIISPNRVFLNFKTCFFIWVQASYHFLSLFRKKSMFTPMFKLSTWRSTQNLMQYAILLYTIHLQKRGVGYLKLLCIEPPQPYWIFRKYAISNFIFKRICFERYCSYNKMKTLFLKVSFLTVCFCISESEIKH